jgi:RNA polymerase sigma-70 factor (ECF subfamily)
MQPEPSQLVERARRGDETAADELIRIFYERIFAFLRRLTGTEAEAADLTQKAFSRIWRALPSFAGRSSVSSWMHSIAYRVYVDGRRSNHFTESRPDSWWDLKVCPARRPDEAAASGDLAKHVFAAVDRLNPELRETVHLHYYQELTLQETADAMGVSASTVKYRLRQALSALETDLKPKPVAAFSRPNLQKI